MSCLKGTYLTIFWLTDKQIDRWTEPIALLCMHMQGDDFQLGPIWHLQWLCTAGDTYHCYFIIADCASGCLKKVIMPFLSDRNPLSLVGYWFLLLVLTGCSRTVWVTQLLCAVYTMANWHYWAAPRENDLKPYIHFTILQFSFPVQLTVNWSVLLTY